MEKAWWKEAIAYQIYPRSFMDSNGDGIGDLPGIVAKLDYLQELGIDLIWICPIYRSPNDDNGYDISNYEAIMEEFGTMADFDRLLQEAHSRGIRVILDLVINHTSDEHPWFIESRSSKDNPKRDYYIWRDGKKGAEPNNWESIFGGSAWQYDETTDQYYLHLFSRKQPDLNWENPEVRRELYRMVNRWLDKGIDGFRIDAISHIKKAEGLPDLPNPLGVRYVPSMDGHLNREGIQEYLEELKRETFDHYDIMTVGEANGVRIEDAELWVGSEQGKFNMIFQFELNGLWQSDPESGLDLLEAKRVLTRWQEGLSGKGWNALYLENHDLPRSVSLWADDGVLRVEAAKALATMYVLMQGTPFIYQGQELGMTNVRFDSIDDYNDVSAKNRYQLEIANGKSHEEIMQGIWRLGRDNARTPMQWSDEQHAGFTNGTPWLKVNPNYVTIHARQAMDDPHSVYHYYKALIRLRKGHETLVYGEYELLLPEHEEVYAYKRTLADDQFVIVVNMAGREVRLDGLEQVAFGSPELLLSNYPDRETSLVGGVIKLMPYEARVYRKRSNPLG